jgi:hypothetical protein
MAVKKTTTEATEDEKTTSTDNLSSKVENAENGTQEAPQTATEKADIVKLIYIGPSLPKAMLKSNRIFEGTEQEIKTELAEIIEKFPLVEKLLVPTSELAEKKNKVATSGNILNKYYSDIVSASAAAAIKEE